ncbi:MAG: hypothetical protein PHH59_15960 [Methylovulum sp.]|uniref:hypothetical protein n=1 Tax=Methylovulum sp. TaxID=1916980 RepID=UPI0026349965|nr:hypothetical protein [Methylovulum sp.]MDD2725502.1 hypothetical protein [Methylovulum sp.]
MNSSEPLGAGLKALPDKTGSFASTQAAWRFYANESVSLPILQEPLTAAAHEGIEKHCSQYALCVHTLKGINDWSRLSYKHLNKTDTYATSAPCGCHARNGCGLRPAIQLDRHDCLRNTLRQKTQR